MGAYEIPGFKLGVLVAGQDLSAKQFRFTKLRASDGHVVPCSVAGENSLGLLQNKPTSGVACELDGDGVSLAIAGGTVSAGETVTTDANGAAVAASAGNIGLGIALSGAVANDLFPVFQKTSGKV